MTTIQLAQRLTRVLSITDLRTLPPEQQQLIVDAINSGIAEFVELLPEIRRAEPRHALLQPPTTQGVTCTNGSTALTFDSFPTQAAALGSTVTVGSDNGRYQRLVALNTLAGVHNGPTGETTMTVYSDVVQFDRYADAVETLNGELTLQEGNTRHRLLPGRPQEWYGLQPMALELGLPRYWWMESLNGMTGLDSPLYVLRVWPLPVATFDVIYSLRLFPQVVSFVDLLTARALPVTPIEETHLVNICMPGMFTSTLWNPKVDKNDVRADYARAIAAMKPKQERSGSTGANMVGTRRGW